MATMAAPGARVTFEPEAKKTEEMSAEEAERERRFRESPPVAPYAVLRGCPRACMAARTGHLALDSRCADLNAAACAAR